MYGIIKPRIGAYATLEAPGTAIDLTKELYLQPPLIALYRFSGFQGTRQFRDADKLNSCDQVHESLWNSYKRTDLTDSVYLATVNWRYPCKVIVKSHCNRRA